MPFLRYLILLQVMGEISEADWTSGKCFQGAAAVNVISDDSIRRTPVASKPFMNPLKSGKMGQAKAQVIVWML